MNLSKSHSIIALGGRRNDERQQEDFYATEPVAVDLLIKAEPTLNHIVWECACGMGHLSERFKEHGFGVRCSDLIARGFECETIDFLKYTATVYIDIVTNPPFKLAENFIRHGMDILENGRKLCLFLKLTFLESERRTELFKKYPPIRIHVCKNRIKCAKNGDFSKVESSPTCYAWFVWEKGYSGSTVIDRI